jgi:tetratricopeptide (TPR) repeat protein
MRVTIAVAVVALLIGLGAVQLASYSLYASVAAPGTLPTRISERFGLAVYRALDHIAPAPYVEATLAEDALEHGDTAAPQRYALRLPASPSRDELLARVALSRGEPTLAFEYFLAAPDVDAVQRTAERLAARSPAAGYQLERLLMVRLALLATHPDAVAETYWRMGELANRQAWREISGSPAQNRWLRRGLRAYERAVALAPLSERYIIADANQADLLGDERRAEALFRQGADVDPGSGDAIAGLGVMALHRGDRAAAAAYLQRARAIDPDALMVRALTRDLAKPE